MKKKKRLALEQKEKEMERLKNLSYDEIVKWLEMNNVSFYEAFDDVHDFKDVILVPACAVYEVLHDYIDWTDNPKKDYGHCVDKELRQLLELHEDKMVMQSCENCCGCGGW